MTRIFAPRGCTGGAAAWAALTMPSHAVAAGESLGVNDKEAPVTLVVPAGKFCLTQTFQVSAAMTSAYI